MARNRYTYTADGPFAIHRMLPLLEAAKRDGIITDFGIEESGRRYYAMGPKLGERVTIYAVCEDEHEPLSVLIKKIRTFLPRTLEPKDILRPGDQWRGVHIPWNYVDASEFGTKVGHDPDGRIQFRRIII